MLALGPLAVDQQQIQTDDRTQGGGELPVVQAGPDVVLAGDGETQHTLCRLAVHGQGEGRLALFQVLIQGRFAADGHQGRGRRAGSGVGIHSQQQGYIGQSLDGLVRRHGGHAALLNFRNIKSLGQHQGTVVLVVQLHGGRAAVGTVVGPPLDVDLLQALDLHGEGLFEHRPLRQLHGAGLGNGQSNIPPGLPEVELMPHEEIQ